MRMLEYFLSDLRKPNKETGGGLPSILQFLNNQSLKFEKRWIFDELCRRFDFSWC